MIFKNEKLPDEIPLEVKDEAKPTVPDGINVAIVQKENFQKIDDIARLVVPTFYLLFCLVYFSSYLYRYID